MVSHILLVYFPLLPPVTNILGHTVFLEYLLFLKQLQLAEELTFNWPYASRVIIPADSVLLLD